MLSYLPDVADASRIVECQDAGTPAGTVVVRAAGLRVHGWTVTVGDAQPPTGELAVFCRPVVTAPAVVRRDGTVLAGGWLPDSVRMGELERHLGDGVIEEIVAAALERGRLKKRQRIMSYPGLAPTGTEHRTHFPLDRQAQSTTRQTLDPRRPAGHPSPGAVSLPPPLLPPEHRRPELGNGAGLDCINSDHGDTARHAVHVPAAVVVEQRVAA